jgi:hypothetical protein
MGAKSLCIPFNQPELPKGTKVSGGAHQRNEPSGALFKGLTSHPCPNLLLQCIHPQCSSEATAWTMFGRSY